MKKKAVFAYSFSDENAGDFSLNISAIDILVKNNYFVTVVSRFTPDEERFISTKNYLESRFGDEIEVIGSPFRLERSAGVVKRFFNNLHGFATMLGMLRNQIVEGRIKESDLVVLCGGNLLRCSGLADFMRLLALDYPLSLARKYNKKYIIFPQSTLEANRAGRWLLARMLNGADVTFAREKYSYDKLSAWFPKAKIVQTLDLAFFLLDKNIFKEPSAVKKVGFTIRGDTLGGLADISPAEQTEISKEIASCVKSLRALDVEIFFVVQGTASDFALTSLVANSFDFDIPVIEERDTFKLIEIYSELDLLVGMRLHSIILAAVSGTPSYGIFRKEWGIKNPGILADLDLPYSFVGEGPKLDNLVGLLDKKVGFQSDMIKLHEIASSDIHTYL